MYDDCIVHLSDEKNNTIYVDTLYAFGSLEKLSCQINFSPDTFYRNNIKCADGRCNIDRLVVQPLWRKAMERFENTDRLNFFLEKKLRWKNHALDSLEEEYLIQLILDTHFPRAEEYSRVFTNHRKDWSIIKQKYTQETYNSINELKHFHEMETSAFSENRNALYSIQNDCIYIVLTRKFYEDPEYYKKFEFNSKLDDMIVRYRLLRNKAGFLQMEKKLMNPQSLLIPKNYE
jgi:hypothetical protein